MRTIPLVGTSKQPMMLSNVVFPDPEGPIIVVHSSFSNESVTSLRALVPPLYTFVTFSKLMRASSMRLFTSQHDSGLNRRRASYRQCTGEQGDADRNRYDHCLLYTSPSPRDGLL